MLIEQERSRKKTECQPWMLLFDPTEDIEKEEKFDWKDIKAKILLNVKEKLWKKGRKTWISWF